MTGTDDLKRLAGEAAAERVEDNTTIGIGTGSTAEAFIRALAERVRDGLSVTGVATSERSAGLCRELGIALTTLETAPRLDMTIDGADEIDADLSLIKGGGGALLREKIVAAASTRMLVVADAAKVVDTLGAFALPVEVNGFGLSATYMAVRAIAEEHGADGDIVLRHRDEKPFITDNGHLILDASFGRIRDAKALSAALLAVPGVVEHGLFIGLAQEAIIAAPDGLRTMQA